jgi:hypothetical protein
MQIKYETSISLSGSKELIEDAAQATRNPFKRSQTGREDFISCFYVVNAGGFSDQARTHFFNSVARIGVRDARLLDGNALLLLDRAAFLNRDSLVRERLTGLQQEIRVNKRLVETFRSNLETFAVDQAQPFPMQRFRTTACGSYLNAPFAISGLPIPTVELYWQALSMLNKIADSMDGATTTALFVANRATGVPPLATHVLNCGEAIESAIAELLARLGETPLSEIPRVEGNLTSLVISRSYSPVSTIRINLPPPGAPPADDPVASTAVAKPAAKPEAKQKRRPARGSRVRHVEGGPQ